MGHIILWSVLMIFGKNTNTVKRGKYCVFNATKKVNIKENAEKTSICSLSGQFPHTRIIAFRIKYNFCTIMTVHLITPPQYAKTAN